MRSTARAEAVQRTGIRHHGWYRNGLSVRNRAAQDLNYGYLFVEKRSVMIV